METSEIILMIIPFLTSGIGAGFFKYLITREKEKTKRLKNGKK